MSTGPANNLPQKEVDNMFDFSRFFQTRKSQLTVHQQDALQAIADWFQVQPSPTPNRNLHKPADLLNDILSRLPIEQETIATELLVQGWKQIVGPFIAQHASLVSIVKGVAVIHVLQPAIRYQLLQLKQVLLSKLQDHFGHDKVRSLNIKIG